MFNAFRMVRWTKEEGLSFWLPDDEVPKKANQLLPGSLPRIQADRITEFVVRGAKEDPGEEPKEEKPGPTAEDVLKGLIHYAEGRSDSMEACGGDYEEYGRPECEGFKDHCEHLLRLVQSGSYRA